MKRRFTDMEGGIQRMNTKIAMISVFDKTGVVDFARGLVKMGFDILSSGGTYKALREAGIEELDEVQDYTRFPEMMEGRVKTLHPKIHGGILADRNKPGHLAQATEHGILLIDLVCVNLYPFADTVARPGVTLEDAIENIDIGGPSMVRSAAKNHASVTVVVDPADYSNILQEMQTNGGEVPSFIRWELACKAFGITATYDDEIHHWLNNNPPDHF